MDIISRMRREYRDIWEICRDIGKRKKKEKQIPSK